MVHFAHEYFRKGRPDMLYKIQRITKSVEASSTEIAQIKDDIAQLQDDIIHLSHKFDCRLQAMAATVESDYQQRMMSISLSYQALTALSAQMVSPYQETPAKLSSSSPPQKEEEDKSVVSVSTENSSAAAVAAVVSTEFPTSNSAPLCPLMTLSGVASAIMERL